MLTTLLSAILVINEMMASNAGEAMSPAINFDSWIELYNPSDQPVNLYGMYLSDQAENLMRWKMPRTIGEVPAKGFKVVWLGSHDIKSDQAPFKLDCDGGTIYLSDASGQLVASQEYPTAMSRTSWARKTDGGEEWGWTATATPGATNATATFATERLSAPKVSVGSKLFTGTLNVKVDIPAGATLMYTTDGSLPAAPKSTGADSEEPVSPWTNLIVNSDCEGDDATCFVCRDGNASEDDKDIHRITDGAGVNGSRGIKVHAVANAKEDWTTQFFVYTPNHVWKVGEHYRFSMIARADVAAKVSVQSHSTPGNYIYFNMLANEYTIGTEWNEIYYEGTITSEQVGAQNMGGGMWGGWWGGEVEEDLVGKSLQTIAFNLNIAKDKDNNFYFDNISWELSNDSEVKDEEASKKSENGEFSIAKTTNYTFRLFKEGYLPSVPVTRSYIQTSNKYTFPVISIVGDKRYFTDPKIGIDCDGDGTNGKVGNGQNQPRNYNMDWDRPVNFSYIGTDGEMQFNQDVNISVSGGWTRSLSMRSFKLKSNKIFDGQNRFDFSFFPQKPYIRNKAILLRNGGNDVWEHNSRFMDPALQTIIQRSGIDIDVQCYVPIIEYVNGELRGVLNLRETNNDKYVYANFGYDDEEIDMFENFKMSNGTDASLYRLYELGAHINDTGVYDELRQLLDVDEFTNWIAMELFLGNDDWPDNNIKAYRSQKDGRYRFVCYDLDYSFALCSDTPNDNPFDHFTSFNSMKFVQFFLNLLGHDAYRRKFIDTYCIVAGSVFDKSRAATIVDELAATLRPMLDMTRDSHYPDACVRTIKNQFENRMSRMMTCLQQFQQAKLTGATKQQVTLKTDTEGARLLINGINVPYADFKGYLFSPVQLEAKAPAGYTFAGWKKDGQIISANTIIDLPEGNDITVTATFKPLTAQQLAAQGIAPVRINEVSAANGIYVNEYFKRNDWVELYNITDEPIDVAGMYITDNVNKPKKYQIAAPSDKSAESSTVIAPHSYLVVWCDKLDPLTQLHASFKLAAEGGDVMLTAADESWTDRLTYSQHEADQTVGRYPDGGASVYVMNVPTIAKANIETSYLVEVEQPSTSGIHDITTDVASTAITSRYVLGSLIVRSSASGDVKVNIHNLAGQTVASLTSQLNGGYTEIPVGNLADGYYIATVIDGYGHTTTCKWRK